MRNTAGSLSLGLLLAGSFAARACWTFAWDPQGQIAVQMSPATIVTPILLRHGTGNYVFFDQLGFYDASGDGLPRDVVVGIANLYGATQVTVPAGPDTRQSDGFRWAYLDQPFFLDPEGANYLYYLGEAGDVVRLASQSQVNIHPLFELGGTGYDVWSIGGPPFWLPPDSGAYAFGANAQYVPEPGQVAFMAVTLLGAGGVAWRRRVADRR